MSSTSPIRIVAVEPRERYVLWLRFSDGATRELDLADELWGPMFEPLRKDPKLFREVQVDEELGTIVWPNGADMDPDVLRGEAEAADRADASTAA
jgi:hypothetical protein